MPLLQQPGHPVVPHAQVPLVHAPPFEHAAHAAPPVPHWVVDCEPVGTQVLPLQQPLAHDVASQTHWPVVVLQACPVPQAPHVAPAWPHELEDCEAYASHVPLDVQQPSGQVLALQPHVPLAVLQPPVPQDWHAAPPVPHWPDVSDE